MLNFSTMRWLRDDLADHQRQILRWRNGQVNDDWRVGKHLRRIVGDRGRDTTRRGTPRTDPDGRSLAHPVLISDEWRRSERQERDGAHTVEGAIPGPKRECASS